MYNAPLMRATYPCLLAAYTELAQIAALVTPEQRQATFN
jgi:hypothetical protein